MLKEGRAAARKAHGLPEDDEETYANSSHTGRNLLMGAGVAAPWLGTIGERKSKHPENMSTHTLDELKKTMRAGDVLMSGDHQSGSTKTLVSLTGDTPGVYHVMLVGNNGKLVDMGPDGIYNEPFSKSEYTKGYHLRLLRPKMSPEEIAAQVGHGEEFSKGVKQYSTEVGRQSRRLKTPVSSKDMKWFANADLYGEAGPGSLLREMYVPKLRSDAAIAEASAKTRAARERMIRDPAGTAKKVVDSLEDSNYYGSTKAQLKDKIHTSPAYQHVPVLLQEERHQPPASAFRAGVPDCAKGVCSSTPAQFLPKGRRVVPGKLPQHVLPSDYARSDLYDTVATHSTRPELQPHEKILTKGMTLARLGAGLGTAGLTYGLDRARYAVTDKLRKHFKSKKEDSEE